MGTRENGFLLGLGAYVIWGFFPLYWPLLEPSGPVEVLAHRIVWSLAAVGAMLLVARRWGALRGCCGVRGRWGTSRSGRW
ncbi:hypothetical protein ACFQV2_38405 [Actinokineospora soli]|uniref:Chloramphenicol-sensitive protein RarD n=1 Tax=Actinokineospora soli TaxID=1048753 RepID=A0ABW2TX51_9PSEU